MQEQRRYLIESMHLSRVCLRKAKRKVQKVDGKDMQR